MAYKKMNDGIGEGAASTFPRIADWIEKNL